MIFFNKKKSFWAFKIAKKIFFEILLQISKKLFSVIYNAGETRFFNNDAVVKEILQNKNSEDINFKTKIENNYFKKLRPAAEDPD